MVTRRIISPLIITALSFLLLSCAKEKSSVNNRISKENIELAVNSIDALANRLLQRTGLPGLAVAVVHKDQVIYAKGFGVRQVGTDKKVDPDTVFQLASISKSLASTVAAGAVGHYKINWQDPVQKYLPNFTLANPVIGSQVTIADMFSHRSGLPGRAGDDLEFLGCSRSKIIHQLRYEPLNPYDTTYGYANFGLTVGAEAVAAAAGQSWEDLSYNVLYQPLGMSSTSSRWADYDTRSNKAELHIKNVKGEWVVSARQPDAQSPSGGVSSNVNDLAKWMMLELNQGAFQGKQIIDKNALLQTWEKRMKLPSPPDAYYALGKIAKNDEMDLFHLVHSGAFSRGASTTFDMLPSEHLGIVVLTNGYPMDIPETLVQEFYDIVYGRVQGDKYEEYLNMVANVKIDKAELAEKSPPKDPKPGPMPSALVGTYVNDYFQKATIESMENGFRLIINPCGKENTYRLSHRDGNVFFFPEDNSVVYLSSLLFIPAKAGTEPAAIKIEFLDGNGLGTFTKVPAKAPVKVPLAHNP